MPGDAGSNDEELMSQIDELRARMDRLMKGGTSTSNSALLTDSPKQTQTVVPEPTPEPAPERTRVRDLLGPSDKEILETYQKGEDAVDFPEEDHSEPAQSVDRPNEDRPPSPGPGKPRQTTVDGSLISVGDGKTQPRPRVSSFDDIGSAVEQELARDHSVPPAAVKKGPDLASRFGPADEPAAVDTPVTAPVEPPQLDEPEPEAEPEVPAEDELEEDLDDDRELVPAGRSRRGAIVAIWSFTGLVSATIAALHFTGVI